MKYYEIHEKMDSQRIASQRCGHQYAIRNTFYVSHITHYASRFAFHALLLITVATTSAVSSELKQTLLNKAFSENLIFQPKLVEPHAPLPNQNLHINSVKTGIRWLLLTPIHIHQKLITHQDGDNVCTFEHSCSHYGLQAIRRHGLQGLLMASNRLLRCYSGNHKYYPSFGTAAYDPVPPCEN